MFVEFPNKSIVLFDLVDIEEMQQFTPIIAAIVAVAAVVIMQMTIVVICVEKINHLFFVRAWPTGDRVWQYNLIQESVGPTDDMVVSTLLPCVVGGEFHIICQSFQPPPMRFRMISRLLEAAMVVAVVRKETAHNIHSGCRRDAEGEHCSILFGVLGR